MMGSRWTIEDGARVARLRADRGLTRKALGALAGIPTSRIASLELAWCRPTATEIESLSLVLGVSQTRVAGPGRGRILKMPAPDRAAK